jgi:AcrR family transcriptional regulator
MPAYAPEMRAALARSAFLLFARRGIANVNLDSVAAEAGVTKGSLYWHYKSKKDLILAACDYYYHRWHRKAATEIAAASEPLEQLVRVLRFSVQSCLFDKTNRIFTTEVFALALQDRAIRASWAGFYDSVRELMANLVQMANDQGKIAVADPVAAVDWMLATIEGIKQRSAFEPQICTPRERERVVKGLMKIVAAAAE